MSNSKKKMSARIQLPLHKIRHGMPGWHITAAPGGGTVPRKCQVVDIETADDESGYWPVKIRYIDRKDKQQGWVNPKHLRFERKYNDLKFDKNLECWHRPTYKGIVLPPQRVVVKEFDENDPQKNVLISYVDSDALIFGRQITFREGWINDRDLWLGTGPAEDDELIETLLNEVEMEEQDRTFPVGCSCFHVAEIDGEKTKPLEVTVVERDDSGGAQNCRIQYKEKDYVVGSVRHRLIGGWVADSSLMTHRQVKEGKSTGPAPQTNPRHVINSTWKCVPVCNGEPMEPRKCRVLEFDKGSDMEQDVRIEFLPRKGEKYAQIDKNRYLIGGWTSSRVLVPCDD